MKTSHKLIAAAGIVVAGFGVAGGSASAAHCTDTGAPGNSDFSVHVRGAADGHHEGGHRGWSSCNPNSANYGG